MQDSQDKAAPVEGLLAAGEKNPVNPAESPPSVWRANPV
jgi:hypothetical protein